MQDKGTISFLVIIHFIISISYTLAFHHVNIQYVCKYNVFTSVCVCVQLGYVSSVFAGGQACAAVADKNVMGFIASLHELAAAERKCYCKLTGVKIQVLQPLLKAGERIKHKSITST